MSNAPRAWVTISGQSPAGAAATIIGQESLRTVYFDPAFARIETDTSVTPHRVTVTGGADGTALGARVDAVEDDIATINDRITTVEQGGSWAVSVPFEGNAAPESLALEVGRFHRIDLSVYGVTDVLTCTLPLASSENVGRKIAVSEISGTAIGPLAAELHITTTSAQTIDGRTLPIELEGTRPRIVFLAVVLVTDTTWGWSVESWGSDP